MMLSLAAFAALDLPLFSQSTEAPRLPETCFKAPGFRKFGESGGGDHRPGGAWKRGKLRISVGLHGPRRWITLRFAEER